MMDKIMEEVKKVVKDEYQRGYEEGYADGELDCRRERAKYTAEKLYDALRLICDNPDDGGMEPRDLVLVFGTADVYTILLEFSAKKIIDKVEAYKEKKNRKKKKSG